jgi:hypothetical protein
MIIWKNKESMRTRWFIIAHCFNADGVAASQTITNRLPYFTKQGIDFVVLSATTGIKTTHLTGYILNKIYGIPWIAELHAV